MSHERALSLKTLTSLPASHSWWEQLSPQGPRTPSPARHPQPALWEVGGSTSSTRQQLHKDPGGSRETVSWQQSSCHCHCRGVWDSVVPTGAAGGCRRLQDATGGARAWAASRVPGSVADMVAATVGQLPHGREVRTGQGLGQDSWAEVGTRQ